MSKVQTLIPNLQLKSNATKKQIHSYKAKIVINTFYILLILLEHIDKENQVNASPSFLSMVSYVSEAYLPVLQNIYLVI